AAFRDLRSPPAPHRSTHARFYSLVRTRSLGSGIPRILGRAAAPRRPRPPEARGPARQSVFLESHTLPFSANFLIARSTVSPTVDVAIPKMSPISRYRNPPARSSRHSRSDWVSKEIAFLNCPNLS